MGGNRYINDFVSRDNGRYDRLSNTCSRIKIKSSFYIVCRMLNETATLLFMKYFIFPIDSNSLSKLQVLDLSYYNLSYNNLKGWFTTKGKLYH